MKEGNAALNLAINKELIVAAKNFINANRRKGRANLSEFTANLWISYFRKKGVKLPPLFKNDNE